MTQHSESPNGVGLCASLPTQPTSSRLILQGLAQRGRQAQRLAGLAEISTTMTSAVKRSHAVAAMRWSRMRVAAVDSLARVVTSSTSSMRAGLKNSSVMRRTTKAGGLAAVRAVDQGAVVVADEAQEIGAAALAPAHVGGVIDEAGEIRVLEIDADGQDVSPPARITR